MKKYRDFQLIGVKVKKDMVTFLGPEQSTGKAEQGLDAFLVAGLKPGTSAVGVLVQETHPAEGLLAARARVLLGLEVSLEVRAKVGLVGKAPGAVVAGKRFLSSVDS